MEVHDCQCELHRLYRIFSRIGFLTSLGWTSILASMNIDVSPILQSYYLFNLGAAICYLGIVLVLRRTYTRFSALEAKDALTTRKEFCSRTKGSRTNKNRFVL